MWFEKLGYDENPFIIKPLEQYELIGYDEIIGKAITRIHSSTLTFIEGDYGTGKTSILQQIIKRIGGKGNILYVDADRHKGAFDVEQMLTKRKGLLGKKALMKGIVMLVDEVETLDRKTAKQIKHFYDSNVIKSVVFTGPDYEAVGFHPSIKERIGNGIIRLKPLSEEDIITIVRKRIGETKLIDDEYILRMYKVAGKTPRKLLMILEKLFIYAAEHDMTKLKDKDFHEAFSSV